MASETLSFDILARDLASSSFKNVGRSALDASGSLKELSSRLDKVSGRVAEARVGLQGDKETQVELDKIGVKLIDLGRRTASPNIDLRGALAASAQIGAIDLALDRLDHKSVTVEVKVKRSLLDRVLSGPLGGLPDIFGSGGGGGGGGLGALGIGGLIGGGALAAGLVPGVVGLGLGGLTGLGGAGLAAALGSRGAAALTADRQALASARASLAGAKGAGSPTQQLALSRAQRQLARDQAKYGGFAPFGHALTGLQNTGISTLLSALTANATGPLTGGNRGGQLPGTSFLAGLTGIVHQFGGFIKSLAPELGSLFRASLPFLSAFAKFLEQSGKILIPAFTQAMNQMVKSGALQLMTQGLVSIVKGLAQFIVALGPGMKASAVIFARLATFIGRTLGVLGTVFTVFAKILTFDVPGAAKKGTEAVVASFHVFVHNVAAIFDAIRNYVVASWDATWRDTKRIVGAGIGAVVGFFKALPGKILGALFGLGHDLYGFAHSALNDLWSGFKAVGGAILSWLGGFVSRIVGLVKKILGIGSPSTVFHEIGVNMMLGLERGIKSTAHRAANAAQGAVGSAGGPTSASAAQAQAYARSRLAAFGWSPAQMGPLIALWNQESGWNRLARNPTSGAYGIPQALPPGKMGAAANPPLSSAAAQINWGLGYIKSVYGSPAGAEAHEQAFNWYAKGGWINEPILGVGLRSGRGYGFGENGPELVVPGGGGGGPGTVVIEFRSGGSRLADLLVEVIRHEAKVRGGGNVQLAFGRRGA